MPWLPTYDMSPTIAQRQRLLDADLPLEDVGTCALYWKVTQRRHRLRAEPLSQASTTARCAGPCWSRSADCPGSRTPCSRPAGRRTARRRRESPSSISQSRRTQTRTAAPTTICRPRVVRLRDPVARLDDPVQRIAGAGNRSPDCRLRVRRARRRQDLPCARIHRVADVARTRCLRRCCTLLRRAPAHRSPSTYRGRSSTSWLNWSYCGC